MGRKKKEEVLPEEKPVAKKRGRKPKSQEVTKPVEELAETVEDVQDAVAEESPETNETPVAKDDVKIDNVENKNKKTKRGIGHMLEMFEGWNFVKSWNGIITDF